MTAQPTEKALFRIDYDGVWFHDGAVIKRHALAKLFADKGLKVDSCGQYWLSSPEEKYPVDVADVPFIIVDYVIQDEGAGQAVDLVTNMGDVVLLGPDHILELRAEPQGGVVVPYIEIRKGLYARISRPVFYNLVGKAVVDGDSMILYSRNSRQVLGRLDEQDQNPS